MSGVLTYGDVVVTAKAFEHLRENPDDMAELRRCAASFEHFLTYWYFAAEGTPKRILGGENLWPAQRTFCERAMLEAWIFFLKARQLGESTVECAWDGWRARFGGPNSRVHIVSRSETESISLLGDVKFGLENLPWWMQLPVDSDTQKEIVYWAAKDDKRTLHAYPANSPGRGETCTHAHLDEWADQENPKKVWSAVEPSVAPDGTFHIVTTGMGPANYTSGYWRKCISGDGQHEACFVDSLQRPDRDERWYARKKKASADQAEFLREYPMKWQDALSGGGEYKFTSAEIDAAGTDFRPMGPAIKGRKYAKGWDIGRHKDAAVGIVLDVTEDIHDVVEYVRLREISYPEIQARIVAMDKDYPGPALGVEANAAGEAVLENLDLPEERIKSAKFTTSKASKARILNELKIRLQEQTLKWDPDACTQLDTEMRGYQEPDDSVIQDSVMALAIAEEYAPNAHAGGRLAAGGVQNF